MIDIKSLYIEHTYWFCVSHF